MESLYYTEVNLLRHFLRHDGSGSPGDEAEGGPSPGSICKDPKRQHYFQLSSTSGHVQGTTYHPPFEIPTLNSSEPDGRRRDLSSDLQILPSRHPRGVVSSSKLPDSTPWVALIVESPVTRFRDPCLVEKAKAGPKGRVSPTGLMMERVRHFVLGIGTHRIETFIMSHQQFLGFKVGVRYGPRATSLRACPAGSTVTSSSGHWRRHLLALFACQVINIPPRRASGLKIKSKILSSLWAASIHTSGLVGESFSLRHMVSQIRVPHLILPSAS